MVRMVAKKTFNYKTNYDFRLTFRYFEVFNISVDLKVIF